MRPEHWLFTIPLRLRSLFRWAQADQELDDELSDHLNRRTEEYVAKGVTPKEARRRSGIVNRQCSGRIFQFTRRASPPSVAQRKSSR